jgi:hypothetical protein
MDTQDISPDTPRTATDSKKPYEKPSFRFEQVFVTTALACGKTGTQGGCHGTNNSAS